MQTGLVILDRKSISGILLFLGNSPITWSAKKQSTVSRSSAEAEYRSMASLTCELQWLKYLLTDLGVSHTSPMTMFCDNQAAIHISQNPVFHEHTKHIELDCHFVRDTIQDRLLFPRYIPSSSQITDVFTKPIGKDPFSRLICKLGVLNIHSPT